MAQFSTPSFGFRCRALLTALLGALAAGAAAAQSGPSPAAPQAPAPPAPAAERVQIPAEDVALRAVVYRPQGAGPHPAVIALHGCGGLFNNQGRPSARHADWGARLAAQGFVVLMPDSFGSRGLGSQCGVAARQVRASRERVADVLAARNWLQAQRDVKPEAISLMGWSNGGATVLAAIREDRKPADGAPDIARAVAFYPGCRGQAESPMFRARVPLLILMGAADDWTPPAPCISLARAAALRGENVELRLYADAYHDFDHPERRLTQRSGLAFSAGEAGTATIGTNDEARRDAIARVPNFLAR